MFWKHCFNKYATFYCIQIKKFESKSMKTIDFIQETQFPMDKMNKNIYVCMLDLYKYWRSAV